MVDRKVGRTRRNRAKARSPLAQLSKPTPEGATEEANGNPTALAPAPYDPVVERELVAGLASFYHHGAPPAPGDFYTPTLARIARAFVEHRARVGFAGVDYFAERDLWVYTYPGLEHVLAELGDPRPKVTAFFAGILASEASVTHAGDVARLAALARARARLRELEEERQTILAQVEHARAMRA